MAATRILVVEDEFLIALDIAGVLEQAGLAVIGPAANVGDALQAIEQEVVHGALLDANIAGEPVSPCVSDPLASRVRSVDAGADRLAPRCHAWGGLKSTARRARHFPKML